MRRLFLFASIICIGGNAIADPLIIPHRGSSKNWPENTLCAFDNVVRKGARVMELDVQVTSDGIPVVYHPEDLTTWTSATGKVSAHTAAEVLALDATVKYQGPAPTACRAEDKRIPALVEVLSQFPNTTIILDLKSLPAQPLVDALLRHVPAKDWKRLIVYSTQQEHTQAFKQASQRAGIAADVFEDRAVTFQRLITMRDTKTCGLPGKVRWVSFEMVRELETCEQTKLGRNCVKLPMPVWTTDTVTCTRTQTQAQLVFFGINTAVDYARARALGANFVYTDDFTTLIRATRGAK